MFHTLDGMGPVKRLVERNLWGRRVECVRSHTKYSQDVAKNFSKTLRGALIQSFAWRTHRLCRLCRLPTLSGMFPLREFPFKALNQVATLGEK
jgi:hypothetical protein